MTLITVTTPTYARVRLLEESIACFLKQTFLDAEMIILNDHPQQTLVFSHPRVRIINVPRVPTLGEKRNILADLCTSRYMTYWDNDDLYLSDHLQNLSERIQLYRKERCCKQWHQWHDAGHAKYRLDLAGYLQTMMVETGLHREVGGFDKINMHEDASFIRKIVGKRLMVGPPNHDGTPPTCIYRRYHGHGQMTVGSETSFEDVIASRIANGQEPVGEIQLLPHWDKDYQAIADASWAAQPGRQGGSP